MEERAERREEETDSGQEKLVLIPVKMTARLDMSVCVCVMTN